ncbi:mediator of RNA polymerase II transcription subunit 22 isoform X3 [Thamnophis elegans]|uniref:mediator of RNA polymerase II transcription subunit 22 isoform X3 n=1 Tax=Thamnophis elegans TaxID=35005 RepID=UPI001377468B|nr:mediator of RNA polymerase II transcription subunit 22 isoform X3 [Thamnophis elegans]
MSQQRVLTQSKETLLQSYNKRLKDDVKSIMDNFTEIIKSAKIEEETQVSRATQGEQDNYEMHVRAANIVRAGESLMKLVSDLKQFLILNDFPSVNEAINQRNQQLRALQEECDKKLIALRDEISIDLYELEEEYYSSSLCLLFLAIYCICHLLQFLLAFEQGSWRGRSCEIYPLQNTGSPWPTTKSSPTFLLLRELCPI